MNIKTRDPKLHKMIYQQDIKDHINFNFPNHNVPVGAPKKFQDPGYFPQYSFIKYYQDKVEK